MPATVTADETLDIVDPNDVVVGTATRAEVHRHGYLHRAVHMLVYNTRGELYVQKRSLAKDTAPGLWDTSAAGHLDSGEDYFAAAHRELREELSLTDVELEHVFNLPASSTTGYEFVRVYQCVTDAAVIPDPDEIADGRWVDELTLRQWLAREPAAFASTFLLICETLNT